MKLGWHEETGDENTSRFAERAREEAYSSVDQKVTTFIEGGLSGLTLGATDGLLGGEDASARAQYNPGTRIAGEIVGGIGGSMAIPFSPAGLAGRIGSGVGSRLGSGLAAKAVGYGVEGALQGAGQAYSASQLSGDPLSAETLFAGAGLGFLVGAGAGAAGHALERAGTRASGALADDAVESLAREERVTAIKSEMAANDTILRGASPVRSVVPDEAFNKVRVATNEAVEELAPLHSSAVEALETIRKANKDFTGSVRSALKAEGFTQTRVNNAISFVRRSGEDVIGQVALLEPGVQKALGGKIAKVRRLAEEARDDIGASLDHLDAVRDLAAAAKVDMPGIPEEAVKTAIAGASLVKTAKVADAAIKNALGGEGIDGARQAVAAFFKDLDVAKAAGLIPDSGPAVAGLEGAMSALKAVEDAGASIAVTEALGRLPKSASKLHHMTDAQAEVFVAALERAKTLGPAAQRLEQTVGEFIEGAGLKAEGSVADKFKALLSDARSAAASTKAATSGEVKAARKAASDSNKRLAKELKDIEKAPREKAKKTKGWVSKLTDFGKYLGGRAGAKTMGGNLVGNYMGYRMGVAAAGAAFAVTHPEEAGIAAAVLGARGAVKSALARSAARWGGMVGRGLQRSVPGLTAIVAETSFGGSNRQPKNLAEGVMLRSQEIAELVPTIQDTAFAATAELRDEHPEFARAVEDQIVRVTQYLHSVLPRNPGTVVVAGKDRWTPSPLQSRDAGERIYAATRPLEACEDYLSGGLSPAGIHAFANCYPEMFNVAREEMLNTLPAALPHMDKAERARVAWITGVPLDSSQRPEAVAFFQQQLINNPMPPSGVPPQGDQGGRPGGADGAPSGLTMAQRVSEA